MSCAQQGHTLDNGHYRTGIWKEPFTCPRSLCRRETQTRPSVSLTEGRYYLGPGKEVPKGRDCSPQSSCRPANGLCSAPSSHGEKPPHTWSSKQKAQNGAASAEGPSSLTLLSSHLTERKNEPPKNHPMSKSLPRAPEQRLRTSHTQRYKNHHGRHPIRMQRSWKTEPMMKSKSTQIHKSQATELLNDDIKSLLNTFLKFKKIP